MENVGKLCCQLLNEMEGTPKRIYTSFGPFGMQPLQETHGKQKPIMTSIQLSLLAI